MDKLLQELASDPTITDKLRSHLSSNQQAEKSGIDTSGSSDDGPPGARTTATDRVTRRRKHAGAHSPPNPTQKRLRSAPEDETDVCDNKGTDNEQHDPAIDSSDDEEEHQGNNDLGFFNQSQLEISDKLKSRIWARQYVDFAKLYFGSKSGKVTTTVTSTSNSVTSIESAPVREINNILTWSRAFQLYASIYCRRYEGESSAMFQYMSIIQSIARKLPNWTL